MYSAQLYSSFPKCAEFSLLDPYLLFRWVIQLFLSVPLLIKIILSEVA